MNIFERLRSSTENYDYEGSSITKKKVARSIKKEINIITCKTEIISKNTQILLHLNLLFVNHIYRDFFLQARGNKKR